MVKFIGQDKQGTASSALKAPDVAMAPLNQSDKSFQFAAQQYQQTGESLKSSLQFQSQIASRVSQDVQQTNATLAETRSKTIQAQGGDNGFSQAMNTLAGVGNMVVQTLDARAKREAAEAKAVREANAATMWERISKWETEAPAIAKFDPAGTVKLRSQLDDLFNSTEGSDLLMEDRTALMKHAYGNVITGLVTKNVESLAKKQEEVVDANRNLRKEKAVFEASSLISGLTAASSVEEQQGSIGKLREYLAGIAQSGELQPLDKAEMQVALVTLMTKAKFSSDDTRLKAEQVMQDYAAFEEEVRKARAAYPDNVEAQETMIAAAAYRYKIPTELSKRYTLTDAQNRALERLSNEEKERDLRERKTAYEVGGNAEDDEIGLDVERFPLENEADYAAAIGGGNPEVGRKTQRYQKYRAVLTAKENFKKYSQDLAEEGAKLIQEKEKLGVADAQSMIAYLKELKPSPQTDAVLQQLRIATGTNSALGALLPVIGKYQELDAANRKLYDDKFAQAQEALLNARQGVVNAIDEVYRVKKQKVEESINVLSRYGFRRNGTYDPEKAKVVEDRILKREAARRARFAEGQGGVEEPANFNRATGANYFNPLKTLYTHVNPERGDLVLPVTAAEIKRQGPGNYNSGVGMRVHPVTGVQRMHRGQDIGLDIGTPLVAHMDAVVKDVQYDSGGGGNLVVLGYADGTEHVWMHLHERPNLAVGQKVKAGQAIAKVGNTGIGTGEHLHWEVYKPDGSLWTPQEWSKQFRQRLASSGGQGRQPSTPGRGSSITAPTKGLQGVPIKGGVLVPNGKGGASVVSTQAPDRGQQGAPRKKVNNPMQRVPGSGAKAVSGTDVLQGAKQGGPKGKPVAGGLPRTTTPSTLTTRTATSTFVGPNGKIWGRDANGRPFQLPDQVGQSGGVSSQPARFSNAAPVRNLRSSNRPGDYRVDDINNHHGFKALKANPRHAIAINSAAKELGVPGEWLAEVISVETGNTFNPNEKERGGSGATGLIQFYPDVRGGSYKTINGKRYDLATIGRMTLEQQVRGPMMDYIREAMRSNGMKKISTIQDLYALVWSYGPASKARQMRDEHGASGNEILNRLGKFSGRKYSSNATPAQTMAESYDSPRANKLTTPIDRRYHASCTSCNQMASLNMFVPHERNILNKGMEVFNLA